MDIQLCCFLAGIYVCGCQNKSTRFLKFKSSKFNVFYARIYAANDVGREATGGPPQELGAKRYISLHVPEI